MKVCVYAISKNEEKFAQRWAQSMSEADEIYVLDTGSTDKTVDILKKCGVKVIEKRIEPWRFDVARNESLKLLPSDTDICVCTDLDEVFDAGWRSKVEKAFAKGITRLKYRYVWSFDDNGGEETVFYLDKIHSLNGYSWKYPVHEVLAYDGLEHFATAKGVQLNHFADKKKSRSQYLALLELAVREDPENDRNMHYLGREYMYYNRYEDAINTLKKHLDLEGAVWKDERCASMRYIARCYVKLNNLSDAYKYYLMAITEAPYLREPWIEAGYFEYLRENWLGCAYFIEYALDIKERTDTYITDARAWGSLPYDVLSIAYYRLGDIERAIVNIKIAIRFSDEKRLKDNLHLYEMENKKS